MRTDHPILLIFILTFPSINCPFVLICHKNGIQEHYPNTALWFCIAYAWKNRENYMRNYTVFKVTSCMSSNIELCVQCNLDRIMVFSFLPVKFLFTYLYLCTNRDQTAAFPLHFIIFALFTNLSITLLNSTEHVIITPYRNSWGKQMA